MAITCIGCLGSCKEKELTEPGIEKSKKPVSIAIDLKTSLINIGDNLVVMGVIILRIAEFHHSNSFVAYQAYCTHQGGGLDFDGVNNQFICNTHGSKFSVTGEVLIGPATKSLIPYTVNLSENLLTVTA
ncbi:MAG: Rieske (2Fe-2S) protein [Pyrinomonadaceae bacterium]|nr:Rieske (2Fe-2S) protein [Sphingobacteriaceae bacterium]